MESAEGPWADVRHHFALLDHPPVGVLPFQATNSASDCWFHRRRRRAGRSPCAPSGILHGIEPSCL